MCLQHVDLGLRKWNLGRGGHRAVIIRVKGKEKVAFRLELEIDLKDEDRPYIAGACSPLTSQRLLFWFL